MKAALAHFSAKGYATTTVADIVATARVSRTTFYAHFADREDCLVACMQVLVDGLGNAVADALQSDDVPFQERTHEAIRGAFRFLAEHEDFASLLLADVIGGSSRAVAMLWGMLDMLAASIGADMARIVDAGLRRPVQYRHADLATAGAVYLWVCGYVREGTVGELVDNDDIPIAMQEALSLAMTALRDRPQPSDDR